MPDISFESFTPRSFEQFAQALAAGIMGPGTFIFGDGPDGGREAEFQGKIDYPGTGKKWNGRITMQAKFRQRPGEGNPEWLIGLLKEDADLMAGRDVPDYYIVITNVRLSGVTSKNRKGGQQKLDEFFKKTLMPLGVKEMHVWHEEKIATLLDLQPDLLRSYRAWLTPREILGSLFDQISDQIPNFGDAMFRMLQRDLREQRSAKLSQAGHVDDTPVPLDAVFVDLPYAVAANFGDVPNPFLEPLQPMTGMLLSDILELTTMKLEARLDDESRRRAPPSRYLVLGGPGQGKSTIGQFLAQIARVRLLQGRSRATITPETVAIMDQVSERVAALGMSTSGPPRYPLTIDLPTYADHLSRAANAEQGLSLLAFLARQIKEAATLDRLDLSVLRRWLSEQPWLVVLDGLDEVPPSANRREVIIEIERFWDEVVAERADVAMVISSRPQGYNDELDRRFYLKLEMTRLEPSHALAYAEKLAVAKIPTSERELVLSRMQEASESSSTQLLMISPLQVAIMIQIASQGVPSANRWELFDEYRSIIVKRELGKRGRGSETLRKHKNTIDLVLRRAGLLLHLEAEQAGKSESFLTPDRLKQIAYDVLIEDQREGKDLIEGPSEIVELAIDRLVLLEQRVEGRIAFEVRSLQEYLAAAELMAGGDAEVGDRIKQIVGRNHWNHVFRIAAAKSFSDSDARKYRDNMMTAIDSINADPEAAAVQRSSLIAMELILDGVAHQNPGYLRILINKAFGHLLLGPESVDRRFSDMLGSLEPAFRDPLKIALSSQDPVVRGAAWAVLLRSISRRGDWADVIASDMWPSSRSTCLEFATYEIAEDSLTHEKLLAAVESATVRELLDIDGRRGRTIRSLRGLIGKSIGPLIPDPLRVGILHGRKSPALIRVMTLRDAQKIFSLSFTSDQQAPFRPLALFAAEPEPSTLASVVRSWEDEAVFADYRSMTVPWPVQTMISMVQGGFNPISLADKIEQGDYGQIEDWHEAEKRWTKKGMTTADLSLWSSGSFFGREVATVGAPSPSFITWPSENNLTQVWAEKIVQATEYAEGPTRASMSWLAALAMARSPLPHKLDGERFVRVIRGAVGWLPLAVLRSCDPQDLNSNIVKETLSECNDWAGDDRQKFDNDEKFAHAIIEMISDPTMTNLALDIITDDDRLLEAVSNSPKLDRDVYDLSPSLKAIGYLQGVLNVEEIAPSISLDQNAKSGHSFLLSKTCRAKATESDINKILTSIVNSGGNNSERGTAVKRLSGFLDTKSSTLGQKEIWKSLKLPESLFNMIQIDG